MSELMQVIVIVSAMALVVLAIAAFFICTALIRLEGYAERLVLMAEMDRPAIDGARRGRPPDRKTKTPADRQAVAPMVRRAQMRLEQAGQRMMGGD